MAMKATGAGALCALLLLPWPASPQGLGDVARKEVARKEKERRSKGAEPATTYTNANLPDRPPEATEPPTATPAPGDGPAGVTAMPDGASPTVSAASEASWRARGAAARQRLEAAERSVADLEKKGATPGLIVRPVPCVRHEGIGEQQKNCYESSASDPLGAARAELDAARKASDDLEESARRSGVPPGWLR